MPLQEFKASPPLPLDESLWLEVRLGDQLRLFELRTGDDRAIVVGADIRSHVRVDRPGVAPVEFHFERDGSEVYVAPGYQAALRVNTEPVRSRTRLPREALVEIHGVSLDVRVLDRQPDGSPPPFTPEATAEHVRSYQVDHPLDAATVRFRVPGSDAGPETSTVELSTRMFRRPGATAEVESEPATTEFVRQAPEDESLMHDTAPLGPPSTERLVQPPVSLEDTAPLAFERTLVIEQPTGKTSPEPVVVQEPGAAWERTLAIPKPVSPEAVVVQEPGAAWERTLAIPKPIASPPAPAPAHPTPPPIAADQRAPSTPEAAFLETRALGSMTARGELDVAPAAKAAPPISPAPIVMLSAPILSAPAKTLPSAEPIVEPCPKTPKTDVRPEPRVDAAPAQREFEPARPAPRLHTRAKPQEGLSASLNEATTAFEVLRVPQPAAKPAPEAEPTAAERARADSTIAPGPSPKLSLAARLGLQVKARPVPVIAAALGVALVVGLGSASLTKALSSSTPAPTLARSASRSAVPPPRSAPAVPTQVPRSTPAAVTASVAVPAAPASSDPAAPKAKSGQPADPELAAAV
ncbi:MAG TPA: hypothetical protein VM686_04920, partial [Polyangiaceae bacterium]|nr:hypothetical protein [Polyangiaceae bacterium]